MVRGVGRELICQRVNLLEPADLGWGATAPLRWVDEIHEPGVGTELSGYRRGISLDQAAHLRALAEQLA